MNPAHRTWSTRETNRLRELYPTHSRKELVKYFPGRTAKALASRAKGLHITNVKYRPWTPAEDKILRARYPHESTHKLAAEFGRKITSVYQRANRLGLQQDPAFKLEVQRQCGRLAASHPHSIASRIQPGAVPPNKGLRRPGYSIGRGRMQETQFKKGQTPHTWMPVGSTRVNADGYTDRKISDTGYPPADWKGVHVLLWKKHRGRIPRGHLVVFKDHDKTNIRMSNLECITKAENMRRNTVHNLPPDLKKTVYALIAVKTKITKLEKKHGQENDRHSGAPVRGTRPAQDSGARRQPRRGTKKGQGNLRRGSGPRQHRKGPARLRKGH